MCTITQQLFAARFALLAPMARAYRAEGLRAALAACPDTSHGDAEYAWELAMAACFGPTGELAKAYQTDEGRPNAECLARFPYLADAMRTAEEKFCAFVGLAND